MTQPGPRKETGRAFELKARPIGRFRLAAYRPRDQFLSPSEWRNLFQALRLGLAGWTGRLTFEVATRAAC